MQHTGAQITIVLLQLQGQGRAVTCLDVDASGSRVVAGSLDYTIRMFDFGGMKNDLKSFRWAGVGGRGQY
jgi:hypothetical protein